ncbi:uncharacterized protein V6R79_016618 [Siganus canaliculatus]
MALVRAAVMVITLFTICLLAMNASAARYECCRSYLKTKIPFNAVIGYSIQPVTGQCHIPAIIFHVKKGKACTNPALDWVMDYVNRIRNKAQMVHVKSSRSKTQV